MDAEVLNHKAYRGFPTVAGIFRVVGDGERHLSFRISTRRSSLRRALSRLLGQLTPFANQLFEPFEPLESWLQGCRGLQPPRPADFKAYHRARQRRRSSRGTETERARFPGGEEHISQRRDEDRVDGDRAEGVGEKREKTERDREKRRGRCVGEFGFSRDGAQPCTGERKSRRGKSVLSFLGISESSIRSWEI